MKLLLNLDIPAQRVLDFDIETRPLSYLGSDYTTGEITAIAASFSPAGIMHCWLLGEIPAVEMLEGFRRLYDEADVVTGHYIRRFDLPVINGAMLDHGLPPLTRKLASDTKLDLARTSHISVSQENLSAMLKLAEAKRHMTQHDWREANRLRNVRLTEKRVTSDVRQHQALRSKLIELGMLGPPRTWDPHRYRR